MNPFLFVLLFHYSPPKVEQGFPSSPWIQKSLPFQLLVLPSWAIFPHLVVWIRRALSSCGRQDWEVVLWAHLPHLFQILCGRIWLLLQPQLPLFDGRQLHNAFSWRKSIVQRDIEMVSVAPGIVNPCCCVCFDFVGGMFWNLMVMASSAMNMKIITKV